MNFLILPWITDPPARPPAVYIKLGIHQSLSLLLYLRMEAHTLKTVWLWRSVGACAHKRVEEPSVLGCLLWSVLQRQDFLIIFSFLNICLSLEPPKTIAWHMSVHLWKPRGETLLNHSAVLRSFPVSGQQWQCWHVLWNICYCLRTGRKQFILSPVAVARLTVTSVKLTCPTEIQKIKALSNFRISTCTQFPQRSVVWVDIHIC